MYRHLSLPFALLLALPTAACLGRGNDSQEVSSAIEQPNGGFDTADEAPAFGDETELAAASIEADTTANDTLASDPATIALDQASAGSGFKVIVMWGKMPADRTALAIHDWTGSFKISRGGLVVRRTIAFEDTTDHLLPRTSLDTVSFQSLTRPFMDGLSLTVLDPTPSATEALTLTYTPANGTTSYTLDLSQLTNGPIVVDAGGGDKMIAIGHPRQVAACDNGFMRGRWHALSPHLGRFLGIVTNEDGDRVGHVRGVYGQRRDGESVVFGKFIDTEGHFRGLLGGTFENGEYRARWIDRQGDHGAAHGVYFEGATASSGGFLGRWAETSCSTDH
jgi:hypothetical protein